MSNRLLKRGLVAAVASVVMLSGSAAVASAAAQAHHRPHIAQHTGWHHDHGVHSTSAIRGWGRVVTRAGSKLHVRSGPGTGYRVIGWVLPGSRLSIACKKLGTNVRGNKRWYKLSHRKGYVSARYVRNHTTIPWC
jgi:uncharacterized protein YgiM (DUF1202 family)